MSINNEQKVTEILKAYAETFTKEVLTRTQISKWIGIGYYASAHPRITGLILLFRGKIKEKDQKMVIDEIKNLFEEIIKEHGIPKDYDANSRID